jgi:hypothetical protein
MSIIFGRLDGVCVKINSILKRASPSIGDRSSKARMDLESITLYLTIKHLGGAEIHAEINKVL